jgi:glycolate dehydrogenase FAD-linked subunit
VDAELKRRLADSLGRGATIAGDVVTPHDQDAAVTVIRTLADAETRFQVRSSADAAAGAADAGVVVSLERLTDVAVHAGGLTLRAQAGAPLDAVRSAAAAAGLAVVGLGGAPGHTGSIVARGGVPRRALTGLDLPTGEVVTTGGAVLKDVVGYDLEALLLGSMGWLAVILAVGFRLEPQGARTPVAPAPGAGEPETRAVLARAFDPRGLLQSQS